MTSKNDFFKHIINGYTFKGKSITLGAATLNSKTLTNCFVKVPLKTMNRHGLIAGATGTGKTKTLQVLAENLSEKGVPVLLMDVKGDLSGLAKPSPGHPKIDERQNAIGLSFNPKSFPVEILSLSEQNGVRLRATVSEFGPILISRILNLTDTQAGIVAVIFKYCDDQHMPLLDLKDFKSVLNFATNEGKDQFQKEYGRISKASTAAILRKIIELEQQGADLFFGEKSFDVNDLIRTNKKEEGYINIIRLDDIQDRPKLFSTFMLSLLAELYETLPEEGDLSQPKLVLFIDEAHLIFSEASKVLLHQIEHTIKLIRSKGVGIYFVTQNPTDIPNNVLGQLGLKIQHSLRAFTAKDRKAIKLTAQNYPETEFFDIEKTLTSMGIGEALVTVLDEKGRPTPLASTLLQAPKSRMDILSTAELFALNESSQLSLKYNDLVDRNSAYEILSAKIKKINKTQTQAPQRKSSKSRSQRQNPIVKVLTSATFIRAVFGILKKVV
ncbi:MAG: helicase HerA-like domain-containing protein [Flavobacteriaceae bacterium]